MIYLEKNKKHNAFCIFISQMKTKQEILKQYWGYDSFRDSQEAIIDSVLANNNTLALLPTGGGKSICYQIPGMVNEGICIVVSPLIALMKDQVENLKSRGIKAVAIFSGMNKREIDIALDNCVYGDINFLYVSPERMLTEIFIARIKKMKVNLVALDEAHCISQWGHDFRPAYKKINEIMELLPKGTPLIAVTATANNRVIKDVCETIHIEPEFIFKKSFERDNLGYLILEEENKEERLLKILRKANSCGIVYVNTRKKTKLVSDLLNRNGIKADFYHGGLPQLSRDEKQKNWIENKTQVIVSTNAFGMGIDKPDVRVVVHFELPASPEAYFQEAGRAGRDGKKSFAVLLYKASDKLMLEKFHELEFPEKSEIKKVYNCLGNYYQLAIGGGEFNNYEFDLADFCNRFNLQPLVAHHCISILNLAGYLTLSEALYRPPRVKIMVSNSNLYTFQVQNKKYDSLIKLLLRNNEGIFDSYMKISPFTVSNNLKISETEAVKQLTYLTEVSILDFKPASDVPILSYSKDRVHEDRIILPKEIYLDRKKVKKQQLDFMIKLCESKHICRSKLLLSYFDETEFKNCGVCDICIENKKKQLSVSVFNKINSIVALVVSENEWNIKQLVNHIPGFDEKEILEVIQWKLDNNELTYNKNHKIIGTKQE